MRGTFFAIALAISVSIPAFGHWPTPCRGNADGLRTPRCTWEKVYPNRWQAFFHWCVAGKEVSATTGDCEKAGGWGDCSRCDGNNLVLCDGVRVKLIYGCGKFGPEGGEGYACKDERAQGGMLGCFPR